MPLGREVRDALPCHVSSRPGKSKCWQEFNKRGKTPALFSQGHLTVPAWLLAAVPKPCTAPAPGETSCHMPATVGLGPVPPMAPQRLMPNTKGTGYVGSTAGQYFVPFAFQCSSQVFALESLQKGTQAQKAWDTKRNCLDSASRQRV